ncbi:MAG: GGDEF domain-containing protein [Kordiimonadaceae bacterium]|nr:GGDEF domain-containing protein [Kordiimonadaceae bacterium]
MNNNDGLLVIKWFAVDSQVNDRVQGFKMVFGEGKNKASSLARQAMELMDLHDIPAAPPNFTVWYNYVSERVPDLKKVLDQMIVEDKAFSGGFNAEVYETFIGYARESALVQETSEKMQGQAQQLLTTIDDVSGEIKGVSSSIKESLDSFTEEGSLGGIESFIQSMMLETKRFQKANSDLQVRLEQSSEEIEFLQHNLQKAESESNTDSLTGIANRKKFDCTLLKEVAQAGQEGQPLCLAIGDIDHFKQFNDSYGHPVGDQVLKLVAKALFTNIKGGDLAARYGGEEFAIILPNTTLENGYSLIETIRETIGNRRIRNKQKDKDFGNVTLSLGLAQYVAGETPAELLERADVALYNAKGAGRNQTFKAA